MISNFIKTIMEEDLKSGKHDKIITRFPPEPNAYLHIGHARAIITNFELAKCFDGDTILRFDDTNPAKEEKRFMDAIINDIKWLGYTPKRVTFGSDYFDEDYNLAVKLIKEGKAYVDDLTKDEMKEYRGTLTEPGKPSPYRDRSVEENLKLFEEMKEGKYAPGEKTLRLKIDMSSSNLNMRDPAIYRIIDKEHAHTGDKWKVYPLYDYAHPLQDAFEGITHSLCSLEYVEHRPLYDWVIDNTNPPSIPRQIEFGRLNIEGTILSKRYLKELVDKGLVSDYDDPRMPTLVGLKRRGFTPESIKEFVLSTGLSRINSEIPFNSIDHFLMDDLKLKVNRRMAVLNPIKVIITNYPEDKIEYFDFPNNLENEELGSRKISFSNTLYIEREDFVPEKPNNKFKRLSLGAEVRLMGAYFIKAESCDYDENGNVTTIYATYDKETLSGSGFNARKPQGTISYVDAKTCKKAKFNLFESLLKEDDNADLPLEERINPESLKVVEGFVESAFDSTPEVKCQIMRNGYYSNDYESKEDSIVVNRTVSLKQSFK
ncbi:MAG: glutamine--tRNA ligase [Gammaproteobacteria bacterium]|nr:glutamine--tRNA ligase [Gammaproteobacteria bacterium]